jgi:hypothetical protein
MVLELTIYDRQTDDSDIPVKIEGIVSGFFLEVPQRGERKSPPGAHLHSTYGSEALQVSNVIIPILQE